MIIEKEKIFDDLSFDELINYANNLISNNKNFLNDETKNNLYNISELLKSKLEIEFNKKKENSKKLEINIKSRDTDSLLKKLKLQREELKNKILFIGENKKERKIKKELVSDLHQNFLKMQELYKERLLEMKKNEENVYEIKDVSNDEEIVKLEIEKNRKSSLLFIFIKKINKKNDNTDIKHLNWKILPPGEWKLSEIKKYYEKLKNENPNINIDLERISIIKSLRPNTCYVGIDEFSGYVVFSFNKINLHVLENPIIGNAIYLIRGQWKELSKLNKSLLLSKYGKNVKRLVHRGNWIVKLKDELNI